MFSIFLMPTHLSKHRNDLRVCLRFVSFDVFHVAIQFILHHACDLISQRGSRVFSRKRRRARKLRTKLADSDSPLIKQIGADRGCSRGHSSAYPSTARVILCTCPITLSTPILQTRDDVIYRTWSSFFYDASHCVRG